MNKKPLETEKKVENNNTEKKPAEKSSVVPEYVGPNFYGTQHPRTETDNNSTHESLQGLIEKNIKWSQVIYNQNKKIKHRLTMMVIGNYLRLFLILAPILLSIIFLPEILGKFTQYFGQYLGDGSSSSTLQIDPSQLQKLLQLNK